MIRILVFVMTENPGGVESFLVNYYRHIDRSKVQFDFLCNSHEPVAYEKELLALGGRTFHITARSKNRTEYKSQLTELFETHASEWSAIWVNVCSLANIDYLKIAKRYGIKKRIIHSHNSQNMDSKLRGILHAWNKKIIQNYATDYWACSEDAAHWFYNDELMRKVIIIHNAIDVESMKFDAVKRGQIRSEHGWNNKFVIGNVGRLHFQKNQSFAIDVFREYHQKNPESVLVLVGQGEDEQVLKTKVLEYKLKQSVYFAGIQKDIQGWLSSFDLFLFPSKFEGLSVVALEAQANGIPVLASDKVIPRDIRINNNFEFYSLSYIAQQWADHIFIMQNKDRADMDEVYERFNTMGFNVSEAVLYLQDLFLKEKKNHGD